MLAVTVRRQTDLGYSPEATSLEDLEVQAAPLRQRQVKKEFPWTRFSGRDSWLAPYSLSPQAFGFSRQLGQLPAYSEKGDWREEGWLQQLVLTLWVSVSVAACLQAEPEAKRKERVGTSLSKECLCKRCGMRKNNMSQSPKMKKNDTREFIGVICLRKLSVNECQTVLKKATFWLGM